MEFTRGNHSFFYSCFAKSVISIEPDVSAIDKPQRIIRLNNIKNITCLNYGVGRKSVMQMPFFSSTGDNLVLGSFKKNFSPKNLI